MSWLLNLLYLLLLAALSPWLLVTGLRTGKYRRGLLTRFCGLAPRRHGDRPCIWLHAVSVGEVNLLATLVRELEAARPEVELVISTTTRTGYELARRKYAPRTVFLAPLDFSWAVRRTLARIRPDLLVLAELELWPNLVAFTHRRGVPVAVINGRLSDKSFRGYRRIRPLIGRVLRQLDLVAAQNPEYAERFLALGAEPSRVCVTGSLKFDGAAPEEHAVAASSLASLAGIAEGDVVLLAGSTQDPEEQMAVDTFRELAPEFPHLRLIVVPRHPERFEEVAARLAASGLPWLRRSQLSTDSPPPALGKSGSGEGMHPILLVDTIGELAAWWSLAHVGYVGGSMGARGGQNMIEPAACGAAVSFGPRTENFRDVVALLREREAAVVVRDGVEFTAFVRRCLEEPGFARALGERGRELVALQRGATRRTLELLLPLLPGAAVSGSAARAA